MEINTSVNRNVCWSYDKNNNNNNDYDIDEQGNSAANGRKVWNNLYSQGHPGPRFDRGFVRNGITHLTNSVEGRCLLIIYASFRVNQGTNILKSRKIQSNVWRFFPN